MKNLKNTLTVLGLFTALIFSPIESIGQTLVKNSKVFSEEGEVLTTTVTDTSITIVDNKVVGCKKSVYGSPTDCMLEILVAGVKGYAYVDQINMPKTLSEIEAIEAAHPKYRTKNTSTYTTTGSTPRIRRYQRAIQQYNNLLTTTTDYELRQIINVQIANLRLSISNELDR